jgi:hypothetical protein
MHTGKLLTTLLLVAAAAVAIAMAPRLQPAPAQAEEIVAADVCVSLGRFECCVKDENPDKRR